MDGCFWQTIESVKHSHKDDRVLLVPAICRVFDQAAFEAKVAMRTMIVNHENIRAAIVPEPTDESSETIRRRDLLQLCWAISHDSDFCEAQSDLEQMRRRVISRFYSAYGGDPLWLMTLHGWTFPGLPKVTPSLLGLTYLYEDDSLEDFYVYDDVQGTPYYIPREDAHQVMDGVVQKVEQNPDRVLEPIGNSKPKALTHREALQLARSMGKDRATKRKLADDSQ